MGSHNFSQTLSISLTIVHDGQFGHTKRVEQVVGSEFTLSGVGEDTTIENHRTGGRQVWVGRGGGHHRQAGFFVDRNCRSGSAGEDVTGDRNDLRIRNELIGNRSAAFR